MEPERNRYITFHSLNAVRVCAEFCVVHFHITPGRDGGFLKHGTGASALMSFFFVLSGFKNSVPFDAGLISRFSAAWCLSGKSGWEYVGERIFSLHHDYAHMT
jgi:hypothetical protein